MTGPHRYGPTASPSGRDRVARPPLWRIRVSAGVSQSAATPTGVKGHFGTPARKVTLRVSVVGSSLASPSGLRFSLSLCSLP